MSSPTSPHLFKEATDENINIICNLLKENKYTMFLRKVHKNFPDSAIKQIMDTDFGHTYGELHNQAQVKKKNTSIYNNIYFFGFLLVSLYFITGFFTEIFMYPRYFT
jgi:hypothetical protein